MVSSQDDTVMSDMEQRAIWVSGFLEKGTLSVSRLTPAKWFALF